MYKRTREGNTKHLDFMVLDVICLQIAFIIAYAIRFPGTGLPYAVSIYRDISFIIVLIMIGVCLWLNNLGDVFHRGYFLEAIAVVTLTFVSIAVTALYLFLTHSGGVYSRLLVVYAYIVFIVVDYVGRIAWKKIVLSHGNHESKANSARNSMLILAQDIEAAEKIIKSMREESFRYELKGVVLTEYEKPVAEVMKVPVVAELDNAADYVCREWIDEILMYLPNGSDRAQQFIASCAEMGVTVHSVIPVQNVQNNKQFIENVGGYTVVTTAFNYVMPYQAVIKRGMDILGGLVGSVFAIVIGIFIGPIIYINSPGPILFKQKRIGKNGRQFYVYKFRSMYLDAEDRKKALMTENRISDGMMFKMEFDPRVIGNKILPDGTRKTGIGEFIRKTSLDEFPQFFNVLRGDMSLVGTRPPTVDEWEKYKYHHRARLAIKPGITGLWQVSGRSEITDFEEVVRLDTQYICDYRLALDIKILIKTVFVILKRKGAM